MVWVRRRALGLTLCLAAPGCEGDGAQPPGPPSTNAPAPTTTVARTPSLTAEAIPRLETAAVHAQLGQSGFAANPPTTTPGFVTTTSKRADATVSTYGKGPTDVVKIVAEADRAVAPTVLVSVASAVVKGADAKKAETWIKAELKKGPVSPTEPRAAQSTYGQQPFELLVAGATATLSIGRLTTS